MASIRETLFKSYWKVESVIVPGLSTSQHAYYRKLRTLVGGKDWLDLGCGHQVFAEWMTTEQQDVISASRSICGIDLDWLGLKAHPGLKRKVFGNLEHLPFAESSFDLISANMVVEHLEAPLDVLKEIYRCLQPGGRFVFHTPNYNGWATRVADRVPEAIKKRLIWALERREEQDVFLTHYKMNTRESVSEMACRSGFTIEEIRFVSSSAVTASFGPLAIPELLYIRSLEGVRSAERRSNLIATLRKPPQ